MTRRKFMENSFMTAAALAAGGINPALAADAEPSLFPPHQPLGRGQGINPGRVVWVYDPACVHWSGVDYWWKPENFDTASIDAMIRTGLETLTGETEPAKAWQALFAWRNAKNGQSGGYRPGQKIAVKVNMNGAGENNDDPSGQFGMGYGNATLLRCLLESLVQEGGVAPADIVVYDACRIFPDYMRDMCASGDLAGVAFKYRDPYGKNDAAADENARLNWAGKIDGYPTYLPKCVTEASFLINLANLKGHTWGMTLTAKNHFGSFVNDDRRTTPAAAGLHPNIIDARMGDYSVLADLMARRQLGGKTILYLLDALITAPSEMAIISPEKASWQMEPFNGGMAASLFFSQDPVAIDSVGADFLVNEPTMRRFNGNMRDNHGMENYLHEAALLDNPPSGAKYTDGAGKNPGSLGVHEHWNNAKDKQYSRNLGKNEGIELIQVMK